MEVAHGVFPTWHVFFGLRYCCWWHGFDTPHVLQGLLRALEEYGIPVDHIGGTSIGALIGGLYAREGDLLSSSGRAKQFSARMGNIWRMLSDVTYPIVAYTTVCISVSVRMPRCADRHVAGPRVQQVHLQGLIHEETLLWR